MSLRNRQKGIGRDCEQCRGRFCKDARCPAYAHQRRHVARDLARGDVGQPDLMPVSRMPDGAQGTGHDEKDRPVLVAFADQGFSRTEFHRVAGARQSRHRGMVWRQADERAPPPPGRARLVFHEYPPVKSIQPTVI